MKNKLRPKSKPKDLPPRPDELPQLLGALAFEACHFRSYLRMYRDGRGSQATNYTLLLHLRVLIDFFYKLPLLDDCWVGHFRYFLPEFTVKFEAGVARSKCLESGEVRPVGRHLDKRLAHLTATRWREQQPAMHYYEEYLGNIDTLIEIFEDALPEDLRKIFRAKMASWAR